MRNKFLFLILAGFGSSLLAAQLECKVEFATQTVGGEDMEVETIAKKSQLIDDKKALVEISSSEMKLNPARKGYLEGAAKSIASAKAQITQNVSGQDVLSMHLNTYRKYYAASYGGEIQDEIALTVRLSTTKSGDVFDLFADPVLNGKNSFGKPGWIPRLRCTIN